MPTEHAALLEADIIEIRRHLEEPAVNGRAPELARSRSAIGTLWCGAIAVFIGVLYTLRLVGGPR
jgi:hypothetical protein